MQTPYFDEVLANVKPKQATHYHDIHALVATWDNLVSLAHWQQLNQSANEFTGKQAYNYLAMELSWYDGPYRQALQDHLIGLAHQTDDLTTMVDGLTSYLSQLEANHDPQLVG